MSVRCNLSTQVLAPNPEHFIPFLRESYGENYIGDNAIRNNFERVSKVVALTGELGDIAAAASIETVSFDRMITVATSPETTRFGKRGELMTRLLRECRAGGHAIWITIGQQYDKMQKAAHRADMTRVVEEASVQTILERAGLKDYYTIRPDGIDQPLVVRASGPKQGSTQQVWAWEDSLKLA